MVAHLVWQDVKHNLRPIRALPLLLLGLWLVYDQVDHRWEEGMRHVQGAFTLHGHYIFRDFIPVVAAIMGGHLAAERRAGITPSLLAKGVRRRDYVTARLMGAAISSAAVTAAVLVGFYVIIMTLWPWDRVTKMGNDVSPGPLHQLFVENPLANDLISVPMYLAAAAGLPAIGILTGVIVANEYVAIAMTPIFVILSKIFVEDVSHLLNPMDYLDLGYYFYWGPHFRWLIPFAPFLYWGTFAFIIATICQRIFAKKEIV